MLTYFFISSKHVTISVSMYTGFVLYNNILKKVNWEKQAEKMMNIIS